MEDTATPTAPEVSAADQILATLDAEEAQPAQESKEQSPEPESKVEEKEPEEPKEDVQESPKYKVKVRGEELEVPLEELLNGYSRTQDYKVKTAEAAELRRQAETDKEATKAERQRYLDSITQAINLQQNFDPIIAEGNKTDWAKLAVENPTEYVQKKAVYEQRIETFGRLVNEQNQIRDAQNTEHLNRESDKLAEVLPEWRQEESKMKVAKTVATFLSDNGFTKEEIGQLSDHRMFMVVLEAAKYREIQKAKSLIGEKKVTEAPTKVQKPASGDAKHDKSSRDIQMKKRAQSGRIDDQVDYILSQLD